MLSILFLFLSVNLLFASGSKESSVSKALDTPEMSPRLFEMLGNPDYRSIRHVEISDYYLENQLDGLATDWYKDASFYHIWVKSFCDYDGDGVGDFRGITSKLDYIKDLGFDAIWLSPIFDCSGKGTAKDYNMHGYDTINYYEVNDYFGNEEHLMTLLEEAHKRNIKVIFDFVPNHTSNAHPWFILSGKREDGKDDWYLWNQDRLSWNAMGTSSTWFTNIDRHQYYYGAFNAGMPDLNFRNYEVREEMKNVVRYWLNKGFDGVRVDAVRYLIEENGSLVKLTDTQETHEFFQELRRDVIDVYAELGSPKFMVCEAWLSGNRTGLNQYSGTEENPEFNMVFDFDYANSISMALRFNNRDFPNFLQRSVFPANNTVQYGLFLTNHDNVASRTGSTFSNISQLKLASALTLLLPATPFVYYGNEIGQKDAAGYSGNDIRLRFPLDWKEVENQKNDPNSVLALHKTILSLRQKHAAFRRGSYTALLPSGNENMLAYSLTLDNETILCFYNLSATEILNTEIELSTIESIDRVQNLSVLYLSDKTIGSQVSDNLLSISSIPAYGFALIKLNN